MRESTRQWGVARALILTSLIAFLLHGGIALAATDGGAHSAAALHAKYERLLPKLERNIYRRPLYLESKEMPNQLQGDIYALVAQPFSLVNGALNNPGGKPSNWCDVLMLHLNIKYCPAAQYRAKNGAAAGGYPSGGVSLPRACFGKGLFRNQPQRAGRAV